MFLMEPLVMYWDWFFGFLKLSISVICTKNLESPGEPVQNEIAPQFRFQSKFEKRWIIQLGANDEFNKTWNFHSIDLRTWLITWTYLIIPKLVQMLEMGCRNRVH
jgi:hypothetical protein